MAKKLPSLYLIYTAASTVHASGTSLAKAVKSSLINEDETPIIAVIEERCVASSALEVNAPTIAAVVIRNPNYREDAGP